MAITLNQIKKELVNLFRNSDVISKTDRGATTQTDTGTFTAAATHTLATTPTKVKNIRSVTIGGTAQEWGKDYTLAFSTGVITFTTAQTGAYTISYDTGTTDRIFPDYPQSNLKLNQFPRIAVDILSSVSNEFGIGAATTQSTYTVSIICYSKSQEDVEDMISSVKTTLMTNKKSLYYSAFITPTDIGSLLVSEFGDKKVFQRNQDAQIKFSFDTI